VACPFFEPQDISKDPIFSRLPLGQAYSGHCHAAQVNTSLPLRLCNHGYARGRCPHFPASFAVDAYRFAQAPGGDLVWIEEASHAPLRFGPAAGIPAVNKPAQKQRDAFQRSAAEGKIR
jgi:hypothetical protein